MGTTGTTGDRGTTGPGTTGAATTGADRPGEPHSVTAPSRDGNACGRRGLTSGRPGRVGRWRPAEEAGDRQAQHTEVRGTVAPSPDNGPIRIGEVHGEGEPVGGDRRHPKIADHEVRRGCRGIRARATPTAGRDT